MAEKVRLVEPNPTVRRLLERALRQNGFEPVAPDEAFDRFCILCVDPTDDAAVLVDQLDGLPTGRQALLLVLREQDLPDVVRSHERVGGVLVKPVSPTTIANALQGTPEAAVQVSSPNDRATAELATVPHTASYSAIGEQRLKAFIRSEQVTGETSSLWRALGYEIALKVPDWAAIEGDDSRAEAISAWLKDRIDD